MWSPSQELIMFKSLHLITCKCIVVVFTCRHDFTFVLIQQWPEKQTVSRFFIRCMRQPHSFHTIWLNSAPTCMYYFYSGCYFNYEYGFDYERIPDLSCPEVGIAKLIPYSRIFHQIKFLPIPLHCRNNYSSGILFLPCGKDHYRDKILPMIESGGRKGENFLKLKIPG